MRRRLLALAAAAALVLVSPVAAEARAGGGHSTGGGSHSTGGTSHSTGSTTGTSHGGTSVGGGSTGSTGGGTPVDLGFLLTPWVLGGLGGGTLLLILLLVYLSRRGPAADAYAITAEAAPEPDLATDGLAAIHANDPGFEEAAFLERATKTFLLAQQCWSDRNLAAVRPLMGQGAYLSWESQISQMARRHEKDVMQDVKVTQSRIVRAVRGPYEHITVRFDASAVDYTVDDRTGALLTGDRHAAPFTEYWTFERSASTATLAKAGVLEQKCPNCGGPLQVNAIGECVYCKAAITNGTYDWILQRIDQPEYWTAQAS